MAVKTKDSGQRQKFQTGAQRDTSQGKPRFDLIDIEVLDIMQQVAGGEPLVIDGSEPLHTGFLPAQEVREDLIPELMLNRLGGLYHRGAQKYSDNNWKRGIPLSRIYESLFRHLIQWRAGDTSEDHLAAVIWNATALMWTEHNVNNEELPPELGDIGAIKAMLDEFYS